MGIWQTPNAIALTSSKESASTSSYQTTLKSTPWKHHSSRVSRFFPWRSGWNSKRRRHYISTQPGVIQTGRPISALRSILIRTPHDSYHSCRNISEPQPTSIPFRTPWKPSVIVNSKGVTMISRMVSTENGLILMGWMDGANFEQHYNEAIVEI